MYITYVLYRLLPTGIGDGFKGRPEVLSPIGLASRLINCAVFKHLCHKTRKKIMTPFPYFKNYIFGQTQRDLLNYLYSFTIDSIFAANSIILKHISET